MASIIRALGGTSEREVPLEDVQIPDLWHVHTYFLKSGNEQAAEMVLETWHLAHDLLRNIKERYVPK